MVEQEARKSLGENQDQRHSEADPNREKTQELKKN